MNIKIDTSKCNKCEMCILILPDNVGFDEQGRAFVERKWIDEKNRGEAENAAFICPEKAIELEG